MEWWLSNVSGIDITNPKNGYLIMMAIGRNNHGGNDRKMHTSPFCTHNMSYCMKAYQSPTVSLSLMR